MMESISINVGHIYRGPKSEEAEYGGIFLFREVTWIEGDEVYHRRPFNFGECFRSKMATFSRWSKKDVTQEFPVPFVSC